MHPLLRQELHMLCRWQVQQAGRLPEGWNSRLSESRGGRLPDDYGESHLAREVLPVSHRLPKAIFDFAGEIITEVSDRYEKEWGPRPDGAGTDQAFTQ